MSALHMNGSDEAVAAIVHHLRESEAFRRALVGALPFDGSEAGSDEALRETIERRLVDALFEGSAVEAAVRYALRMSSVTDWQRTAIRTVYLDERLFWHQRELAKLLHMSEDEIDFRVGDIGPGGSITREDALILMIRLFSSAQIEDALGDDCASQGVRLCRGTRLITLRVDEFAIQRNAREGMRTRQPDFDPSLDALIEANLCINAPLPYRSRDVIAGTSGD